MAGSKVNMWTGAPKRPSTTTSRVDRVDLLCLIAGVLTLIAAGLIVGALFPRFDSDGGALADYTDELASYAALAAGIAAAGVLLLRRPSRVVGASALLVITLGSIYDFFDQLSAEIARHGAEADLGSWLQQTADVVLISAAALACFAVLRPFVASSEWTVRGRRVLLLLASFLGLATAVGYAMNSVGDFTGGYGGAFSGPLDPTTDPKTLWADVLPVLVLAVAPFLAVIARRRVIAIGLSIGFFVLILAANLSSLLFVYTGEQFFKAIEGTWTLLAASSAVVLVLLYRIVRVRDDLAAQSAAPIRRRPPLYGIAAALLALLGALLTVASIFPTSFQSDFGGSFNVGASSGAVAIYLFLAGGFVVGACLLGSARTRASGAALLLVVVATFLADKVQEIHFATAKDVPIDPGLGFWFSQSGFVLAVVGALIGLVCLRDTRPAAVAEPSRALVVLAAVFGFAASVGWIMNYVSFRGGGVGTPIVGSPRTTWSEVVVFIALPIAAVVAIKARRRLALGLTAGLAVFVLGIGLSRLLYVFQEARNTAAEGTWTFIAAGGALVILLAVRLIQTGERRVMDVICGDPA